MNTAIQHSSACVVGEQFRICKGSIASTPFVSGHVSQSSRRFCSSYVSYKRHEPVCLASKQRSGLPKMWNSNRPRGDDLKAQKLVQILQSASDVKEEVYGKLDAWCAFEMDFPTVPVKKALTTFKHKAQWKRIIQVSKWMMSKGHGKTLSTHYVLLQALDREGRIEEAEELFSKQLRKYLDALPRSHFFLMMKIYRRAEMYAKLLDVFADMEELRVKPDIDTVDMVAEVYETVGMPDKSAKVRAKYPPPKWEYRYIEGKRRRVAVRSIYGDEFVDKMLEKHDQVKDALSEQQQQERYQQYERYQQQEQEQEQQLQQHQQQQHLEDEAVSELEQNEGTSEDEF